LALADILDAIRAEADTEIETIVRRADEECSTLLEQARGHAGTERGRLARSRDAAAERQADRIVNRAAVAERQADRIVNRARLEADRALRSEVEKLYVRIRDAASEKLGSLRGTRCYEEVLARLIRECCVALPDATTLRVDPEDEQVAHRILAGDDRLDLKLEATLQTSGGAWVSGETGRVVRNDFESRLARADNLLRLIFAEEIGLRILT
jgi:vacuolar-type H+-ATPase subunit E/Vma4